MHFIHPICEEKLGPYIGQPVCAILHDGTYYYGICGGIRDGKLILNNDVKGAAGILSTSAKKAKLQLSRINNKAKTSGLGFPGFGLGGGFGGLGGIGRFGGLLGGGLGLGLGLVALLFALPFFGSRFFI